MDELLLNKEETYKIIKVSSRTLDKMVANGEFPKPVKIGSRVLWRMKDVSTWIDGLAEDYVHTPPIEKKRGRPRLAV